MLAAKPDFDEAKKAWDHFWNGEVYKRPLVLAECNDGPVSAHPDTLRYYKAVNGQHQEVLDAIDEFLEVHRWLGEAMPAFNIDHGPDQYAAFLGADLRFDENSMGTNWVDPIVDAWESFLPIELDENNPTFQSVLTFARMMAEHSNGRYLVRPIDAHSHADTLSALRGPQNFCMDFVICPEVLERAMCDIRKLFPLVYDAIYEAGNMGGPAGCTQIIWCEGKCGIIQCDFIIMVGPEHFRHFILPAIEEEAAYLDHTIFHLDGPGAFRHLDDLLAIEALDMIQLVPGAGEAPAHTWTELLKKCLDAGKGVQVYGAGLDLDRIKTLHRELGPKGVMYCPSVGTRREIEEICHWLERNT
ncbi:MAG: hypothetical protein HOC74_24160 [Gemmatimonadetes bacterium]|jgi:hypothetical protein|nr:hypothetical protein [Gemmatimonadota bacterium]